MPSLSSSFHHRSFEALKLIDDEEEDRVRDRDHDHDQDPLHSKALPLRPESPLALSPLLDDDEPASSASSLVQQPPMTKRQHALHELITSERAYASDLALIREVHIPLALGV